MKPGHHPFVPGGGLPAAWAGQPQWRILEIGFGGGLNFLSAWHAWKADPQRPRLLHFVGIAASGVIAGAGLQGIAGDPALLSLAEQLRAQCFGLLPGFHRLSFEGGRVLLTLCIGDARALLREQQFEADTVFLTGVTAPADNDLPAPPTWDTWTFKALAHCCRRGTGLIAHDTSAAVALALAQVGFALEQDAAAPPASGQSDLHGWHGEFNPSWNPRRRWKVGPQNHAELRPGRCMVIGAGLSGAAVASSLARRGWQVAVLDAAQSPAGGASGLPAGLMAPHISPDDSVLSRLSRSGVRATLQQARALLHAGIDWQASGLLEHRVDARSALPADWPDAGRDWTAPASAAQLTQAGLPAGTLAYWHTQAAWIKPARLVQALLAQPGIEWHGGAQVAALAPVRQGWQALDSAGRVLAESGMVVIAAGFASRQLLTSTLGAGAPPLQAIRGQVSYGMHAPGQPALPPFPVNGNGTLIPRVPWGSGPGSGSAWFMGTTYERDNANASCSAPDQQANLQRLQTLLPRTGQQLQAEFAAGRVRAWAGVRCATPDHLPVLGPTHQPGVWICSAMGSRGLSMALLCGELLAARLHGEPLSIEKKLAHRLDATRFG